MESWCSFSARLSGVPAKRRRGVGGGEEERISARLVPAREKKGFWLGRESQAVCRDPCGRPRPLVGSLFFPLSLFFCFRFVSQSAEVSHSLPLSRQLVPVFASLARGKEVVGEAGGGAGRGLAVRLKVTDLRSVEAAAGLKSCRTARSDAAENKPPGAKRPREAR